MIATTEDGIKVRLNENGTWERIENFANEIDIVYNVRKTYWGMSYSKVINNENIELETSNANMLFGKTTLNGIEALIAFDFIKGELYSVRYIFINEHTQNSSFIYDYENLKENLNKKYGKELKNSRFFSDDLYQDIPSDWDMALGRGTLSYFSTWKTDDTEISLSLYGDNYEIKFNLTYSSLKYQEIVKINQEQSLLNDL